MMEALIRLRRLAARGVHFVSRRFLAACIALGGFLTRRRIAKGRPRSLWGITPIITLPLKARCDQALGFRSESLVFQTYYITKDFTWNLKYLIKAFNIWPACTPAFRRMLLGLILLRYDVVHLFADRGIQFGTWRDFGIDGEEMAAIRAAGKALYIFGYGADVRTRQATLALGDWNFCRDCDDPGRYCICDDDKGRELMAQMAQHANALVSLGDMLTYMPGAHHLPYWPVDTAKLTYVGVTPSTRPLRIVHTPNHSHFKGTRYLEAVIATLRARGVAIELVRVSGVPNTEVLRLFAEADIVADQFIGGAYGFTALEALARGKPTLTYVRTPDLVLAGEECPFINTTPDTLEAVLQWCVDNRAQLPAIGAQGRAYIERHHSIPAVAARFAALYIATADFPQALNARLASYVTNETVRRDAIPQVLGWQHPWQVTQSIPTHRKQAAL
jgi:glycosyltransferase involved in cell wall biosynthesis